MKQYAFELGREKELCFAELIAVLGKESYVDRFFDTAIFKLKDLNDVQKFQNSLGGTIKTIEILSKSSETSLNQDLEKELIELFQNSSGKIPFSITLLGLKNTKDIHITKLLNFSKKILKSLGLNSRFVNKGNENAKSSTIYKAKVVEKGADICIIRTDKEVLIGKTVAVQNIDAYSKRDYDKPKRDARVGMTPPKLAQIMTNLAGETKTVYDPFCGTGTFLMEAMLMRKTAVGSDLSERMISYTEENCEWLTEEFKINGKFRVFENDARLLTTSKFTEKIDAIITEGYLGDRLNTTATAEQCEKIFRELANLHLNWLKAVNPLLKKGAKIVMCLAAIKSEKGIEHLPRFKEIAETAGYTVKTSYTYKRSDQITARDIKILEKL